MRFQLISLCKKIINGNFFTQYIIINTMEEDFILINIFSYCKGICHKQDTKTVAENSQDQIDCQH